MNLIKKLKSNEFAVIVAILSVVVQSFHSFYAFYNVSSLQGTGWGIAQAVLFAIVFDLAILFYTVRNKKDVVFVAAVVLVLINAYYYYNHLGFTTEFIFGCFISLILPIMQYYYSEEIREEEEPGEEARKLQSIIDSWKERYNALNESHSAQGYRIEQSSGVLDRVIKERDKTAQELDQVIAWRDQAVNSNSVLSEALGRKEREIFELKKRLGELPEDAEINPEELVAEIRESIQDKSLLNVSDMLEQAEQKYPGYNPTRSNAPTPD